jgi:hypothetical protein
VTARRLLVWAAILVGIAAVPCAALAVWFPMARRPPATVTPRRNAQGDVEIRPTPSPVPTRDLRSATK